jgi:hypothetical protein
MRAFFSRLLCFILPRVTLPTDRVYDLFNFFRLFLEFDFSARSRGMINVSHDYLHACSLSSRNRRCSRKFARRRSQSENWQQQQQRQRRDIKLKS